MVVKIRRFFSLLSVVLLILQAEGFGQDVQKLHSTNKRPSWFYDRPIVLVGNWDSEAIFQRRRGTASTQYIDEYRKSISEETVQKMKDMGVTLVINHMYKGFGLDAETEHIEDTRKFAELCHKYGLKVGVYVGDTICYETFLKEKPEAEEWLVPDYLGAPVTYSSTQTFRRRPYIGHPGFVKYIKKVLKIAIENVKADMIHFDNSCSQAILPNFHHPLAIEQFRDFLRTKYSPAKLKERFGFSDVSYVTPPKWPYPSTPYIIQDPVFQEWTDFRCQKLSDHYRDLSDYIKSLNPEVVVCHNPHGVTGHNTEWLRGIDWPRTIANMQVSWSEGERKQGVDDKGILISKIRTYKIARALDNMVFTVTGKSPLWMAEAMAFNQNCLGYICRIYTGHLSPKYISSVYDFPEELVKYIRFYDANFEHYRDTQSMAKVAILRTFPTMAYCSYDTRLSTLLFEQSLIQAKIPFDIIFDKNLCDLSKYSVLILADQQCLTDGQLELLSDFVRDGGGLVVTEQTSLYDQWRRQRPLTWLNNLFGVDLPFPEDAKAEQIKNQSGQGRAVYIPKIRPSIIRRGDDPATSHYWKLPKNYDELIGAVKWASGSDVSLEIKAPLSVVAELLEQKQSNKILLHLVNYDAEKTPLVANIEVTLTKPVGKKVKEVFVLSPDRDGVEFLDYSVTGDKINLTIPRLEIYDIVIINFRHE